jgi:hypothetical protein
MRTKNNSKPLTFKQRQKFKELYLMDYSAMALFHELGQELTPATASSKMVKYRNIFKLPKRGIGYKPRITINTPPKEPEYYI